MWCLHAEQPARGHRRIEILDADRLLVAEDGGVFDQPGGGLAEHDTARLCRRFHPLCQTHMLAHGGVTHCTRGDFACDDFAGVESDAHAEIDGVLAFHLGRELGGLLLYAQRGQAPPNRMILEGDGRAEDRHDAVAGEFVQGAAVPRDDLGRAVDQLRHDLAQPLRTDGRRDVHRVHDVGEKDRDLLVFRVRRLGPCHRRAAPVAELGVLQQLGAA
jgi:hypothetical protein